MNTMIDNIINYDGWDKRQKRKIALSGELMKYVEWEKVPKREGYKTEFDGPRINGFAMIFTGVEPSVSGPKDSKEALLQSLTKKEYKVYCRLEKLFRKTHKEPKYNLYSDEFDAKACAEEMVRFVKEHESEFIDNSDNFKWKFIGYVKEPNYDDPEFSRRYHEFEISIADVTSYTARQREYKDWLSKYDSYQEKPKKHCRLVELFYW